MNDLLDLAEASKLIGIPAPSLRRRLNSKGSDAIAGVRVKQGLREVWRVSRATVEAIVQGQNEGKPSYDFLFRKWVHEQQTGLYHKKPLGHHSVASAIYGLNKFWQVLGLTPTLEAVTKGNLQQALASISINYQGQQCHYSIKLHLWQAVVSFAKLLIRQGLRTDADLIAVRSVKPSRVMPARRTSLKTDSLQRLLDCNDNRLCGRSTFDQQLTRTALLLMALSGLRRAEALDLEVHRVDLARGTIQVINGKGHKNRMVGMPAMLIEQLQEWISQHRPKTTSPQVLIMADGRPLTESAIQQRVARLRKKAGLDITMHGLRRTCATLMVDSGVPLVHVQRNLGHSDIKTTMTYVMTDAETACNSFRAFAF